MATRGTGTILIVSLLLLLGQASGCARPKASSTDRGSTPQVADTAGRPSVAPGPPADQTPPAEPPAHPEPSPRVESPPRVEKPKSPAPPPPSQQSRARESAPSPPPPPRPASLDLASLERRLRDTDAIGVFTKLSLKNQVDDLLEQFRTFHQGQGKTALAKLRQEYDLLLLKVMSLLQDKDPALARDISTSREALWNILADPAKFRSL